MARKFGFTRLLREDASLLHKIFFVFAGVSPSQHLHFAYLRKYLPLVTNLKTAQKILDAGCGPGDFSFYFADRFPNARTLGVDISSEDIHSNKLLLKKSKLQNLEFKEADLCNLDGSEKYDFICSIDVLEHIASQVDAIQRLFELAKGGSFAFFHVPIQKARKPFLYKRLVDFNAWAEDEHVSVPKSSDCFIGSLTACGFEIVKHESTYNHYLGEFAVSLEMVFFQKTAVNKVTRALMTPLLKLLTFADLHARFTAGNGVAVLARKPLRRTA